MLVNTPCIGVCSTVYGDAVCRGCKRLYHEVIAWNGYTDPEKNAIYHRLASQIADVFLHYVEITDEALLLAKITQLKITHHPYASLPEQAFHLLRLGANKIKHIERYGLRIKPAFSNGSLNDLFNQIDSEIYQQACIK
ncbi:MAG TPA: DUF1289 domain-containing protein [Gammaproteobacteria bacterium]|nr:DUF1289 domain-containing protein [Gammaproteobacteria bacterium]